MFQAGAAGHHLKHGVVRDVVTASNLQVPQLRAALGQNVQAPVREPLAAVDYHRLQCQTHVGGVLTQPMGQDPDGAVGVKQLSGELDGAPQPRVPRQVVPAPAHACAAAQLVGWEMGEDLQERVVREEVGEGVVVGFGRSGASVAAGLRVNHSHRLGVSRGGRRGVGFMAVTGKGRRGEGGGLRWQDQAWTGGAQCSCTGLQA